MPSPILAVQPARIEVVRVPRAMTVESFHRAYPSAIPVEEVARLNRLDKGATIAAGARIKRVVGSPLP